MIPLRQNELRQDLTLKVTRLETKVQEQETIINFLLQANELPVSPTGSKSIAANNRQNLIQSSGKSGIPRTCRELRAANPSLASGMQWIDPDSQGIGDDPINVYCDMSTGKLRHFHLFLFKIEINSCKNRIDINFTRQRISHRCGSLCTDPGCYSRSINYNASSKQIKSLAELSTECHQSIKVKISFLFNFRMK